MVGGRKQTVHSMAQPTDKELVAQSLRANSAEGASAAFGKLVLRYRRAGDQRGLSRVWRRRAGRGRGAGRVCPGVEPAVRLSARTGILRRGSTRIATNMAIDAVRRRRPQVDIEDLALEAPGQGPEGAAVSSERAGVVRAALMRLPVSEPHHLGAARVPVAFLSRDRRRAGCSAGNGQVATERRPETAQGGTDRLCVGVAQRHKRQE